MRLRDRRAVLAAIVLAAAYAALVLGIGGMAWRYALARPVFPPASPLLGLLLEANLALMLWRVAMRVAMVRAAYGWGEAVRAGPRMVIGNIIAMMAARRALLRYASLRARRPIAWDKTRHVFPETVPAE